MKIIHAIKDAFRSVFLLSSWTGDEVYIFSYSQASKSFYECTRIMFWYHNEANKQGSLWAIIYIEDGKVKITSRWMEIYNAKFDT